MQIKNKIRLLCAVFALSVMGLSYGMVIGFNDLTGEQKSAILVFVKEKNEGRFLRKNSKKEEYSNTEDSKDVRNEKFAKHIYDTEEYRKYFEIRNDEDHAEVETTDDFYTEQGKKFSNFEKEEYIKKDNKKTRQNNTGNYFKDLANQSQGNNLNIFLWLATGVGATYVALKYNPTVLLPALGYIAVWKLAYPFAKDDWRIKTIPNKAFDLIARNYNYEKEAKTNYDKNKDLKKNDDGSVVKNDNDVDERLEFYEKEAKTNYDKNKDLKKNDDGSVVKNDNDVDERLEFHELTKERREELINQQKEIHEEELYKTKQEAENLEKFKNLSKDQKDVLTNKTKEQRQSSALANTIFFGTHILAIATLCFAFDSLAEKLKLQSYIDFKESVRLLKRYGELKILNSNLQFIQKRMYPNRFFRKGDQFIDSGDLIVDDTSGAWYKGRQEQAKSNKK